MSRREAILKTYVKLVKKLGMLPSQSHLLSKNISKKAVEHHYGNLGRLHEAAKTAYPRVFENVIDESFFTIERANALYSVLRKNKRFVITTAVTGCKVDLGFLASLKKYCKYNDAVLLVLTAADPASISKSGGFIDPVLKNEHIVLSDVRLNDKVAIRGIKISAKAIDPVTGLSRIGQREGSFIYASPKQRLKMTATSNIKIPHAMMTTGAITKPDYQNETNLTDRTAYIAKYDHVMGAIIVEIEDDQIFHFRQIQADSGGRFADIGTLYTPTGKKAYPANSLVLGDWHSGDTDPVARAAFVDDVDSVRAIVKPRRLVIHDGFNGSSISHHEIHNKLLRAKRAASNGLNLEQELITYGEDLMRLSGQAEELLIVKSNHDEFLDRYLREMRFIEDPQNVKISLPLASKVLEGVHPLKAAMDHLGFRFKCKVTWLDIDEDVKVAGIEIGAHGHKGNNGSRGSLATVEQAYGSAMIGHSHTMQILRKAWQVGTLSKLKLDYNTGPSSWTHTSGLIYDNGQRQLITVIKGKWRLE